MTLEEDLAETMAGCVRRARTNYFVAYVLLIVAVISSASATVSVAAGALSATANAVLAALPGVALLIMNTFKFEARASWWWEKAHGLEALYRGLKYEHRSEADISKEMTAFVNAHGNKWPGFGRPRSTVA